MALGTSEFIELSAGSAGREFGRSLKISISSEISDEQTASLFRCPSRPIRFAPPAFVDLPQCVLIAFSPNDGLASVSISFAADEGEEE
jgi:hypothetical protein